MNISKDDKKNNIEKFSGEDIADSYHHIMSNLNYMNVLLILILIIFVYIWISEQNY